MISNVKATEGAGTGVLKKVIHKGSESIMFSVLQETQYVYPFKSSVREIISNCLDSVTERNNSVKILNGEILESDLYIIKEGTEFSGSKFNAAYYDKKWLSKDDTVKILYIDNDTPTRDRIKFIDNGVGLGGSRLINYFSLGYSSKRLSKNQLGSFGLGAKSLLATGIDYYTVTSYYNGRAYCFNVFKDHVISATPKFNEDGTINNEEIFFEGTEEEYICFYRDTKEKNGVTIETEVKRHRKFDFINSIENQLGFIPNIELWISDANMEYMEPTKRNIATKVLFSTDKLLVGESDYYAVPQILLKPGDDSNIMISYGVINFEELEMKKYSGNVSFILNINDVDVTPSRENVIWNTKTREAIKSMFTTAQDTVTELVESKINTEKNLPDYLTLLAGFRDRNAISGLSELYKIIDVSKIDNSFRNFAIGQAAIQMSDDTAKKDFIFTSTENLNSYGNRRVSDTNFGSALSKEYISRLSAKNTGSNVVVFIGDSKYQGLARYAADLFDIDDRQIEVIYIRDEMFEDYSKKINKVGLEKFLDNAYEKGHFKDVLMAEVIRFAEADYGKVFYDADIDKTKMAALAKTQEEARSRGYMNTAEKAKAAGKVIGNYHSSPQSTYREYYDEFNVKGLLIYQMADPFVERLMRSAHGHFPDGVKVVGFSQENFKRFYKVPGVKLLTDCLYTIHFGDLSFTNIGKVFLNSDLQSELASLYNTNSYTTDLRGSIFYYLQDSFRDFSIDICTFNSSTEHKVKRILSDDTKYLKKEKQCKCKKCSTLT